MNVNESLQNDESTATENALRRAVDTTPAFIHTARPDGYIDYFNRGWLDFFGKSLEDVCGWRWTETVHPADVTAIVQKWHAALASGEPFEIESRVRRADGSYRALLHRKLPLRDEHGNIVKWFGSSTDIEDRRSAERRIAEKTAELERSEFYLREGERLAHMGSWSLSPDGIFDYWSPETFSIFGFDSRNGIPTLKEWLSVLRPHDGDAVHELIRRMFSEGVNGDIQYRVDHPKGGQRTMHSTGEPVFENGKVVRLIGNTLDITQQENATRELQRSEAYLAEGQRLSHTGSFGWDVSSGEIYWSNETFRIFEVDPKTEITIELIVQRTHPDDRQAVQQVIERASRDRTEFTLEHRLLIPDGSIKYLQVVGRPSPDVFKDVAAEFLKHLKETLVEFYGQNPQNSPDLGRIVSTHHFDRLVRLLGSGTIFHGGQHDRNDRFIAPTVLTNVSLDSPAMQEEIFGPILPVLEVDSIQEVIKFVNARPCPLGLYVFSEDSSVTEQILNATSSGDADVNDCTLQPTIHDLPFGGVGNSGMGKYHGEWGFRAYSNARGILSHSTKIDIGGLRYPPYDHNRILREIVMPS